METKDRAEVKAAAELATKGKRQVIAKHSKPYGVRNGDGFICFMRKVTRYSDQEQRYLTELTELDAEARLIALTDPDTVIALLDALDETESDYGALEDLSEKWSIENDMKENIIDDLRAENTRLRKALDEAEKLWDIKEWPVQTHIRSKTMAEHIKKIKCLFGDELSPFIKITPATLPKKRGEYLVCGNGPSAWVSNWEGRDWGDERQIDRDSITHYQKIILPKK